MIPIVGIGTISSFETPNMNIFFELIVFTEMEWRKELQRNQWTY